MSIKESVFDKVYNAWYHDVERYYRDDGMYITLCADNELENIWYTVTTEPVEGDFKKFEYNERLSNVSNYKRIRSELGISIWKDNGTPSIGFRYAYEEAVNMIKESDGDIDEVYIYYDKTYGLQDSKPIGVPTVKVEAWQLEVYTEEAIYDELKWKFEKELIWKERME